ncbi:hypothetical protein H4R35_000228 [Dimargaris xerosporica]|nr:hypothetical protein H4R35_000228 [Dimargaris xerosporica]
MESKIVLFALLLALFQFTHVLAAESDSSESASASDNAEESGSASEGSDATGEDSGAASYVASVASIGALVAVSNAMRL